jgi:predicted naringenin-chalcone synthase
MSQNLTTVPVYIYNFRLHTPPYIKPQEESLKWLAAEYGQKNPQKSSDEYFALLRKVGAKPPQVHFRGHYLAEYQSQQAPREMFLPEQVAPIKKRMEFFSQTTLTIFDDLFKKSGKFDELLHVTCTGYVSPSGAQRWVTQVGREKEIRVRHVYHMGCYAALPAIQQAYQSCQTGNVVEICHTELCSLHLNPVEPSLEQIVVDTLFSDGACAYSVIGQAPQASALKYISSHEEMISDSASAMSWGLSSNNFDMTLSKDVPTYVKKSLPAILARWLGQDRILEDPKTIWAIHPGGPKIIDEIKNAFSLREEQICYSRKILSERGNMSSATLPHIWNEILNDPLLTSGTPVLTMAFGPGLTVSLARFELCR